MLSQDTVLKIFQAHPKAKTHIHIYPANHISGDSIDSTQWIGLRENLNRKPW